MKSYRFFLWTFDAFSLIWSPVLVPDHFLSHIPLSYESVKHKTAPNSRDEPLLCLHITDNFAKNQLWIVSWGTWVLAACCKDINCSLFFLLLWTKITQFYWHKTIFFAPTKMTLNRELTSALRLNWYLKLYWKKLYKNSTLFKKKNCTSSLCFVLILIVCSKESLFCQDIA